MSSEIFVRRLLQDERVDFECEDEDLTSFFQNDSHEYLKALLAVTYAIEFRGLVIAMFSLCNDRLDIHDFDDNRKLLKKAASGVPHPKRGLKHFPAVKIARLAVRREQSHKGMGRAIVGLIQAFIILKNKTGCRFLTVDAYPNAVGFYERVGFKKVEKASGEDVERCSSCLTPLPEDSDEDENNHSLMFLDLGVLVGSSDIQQLGSIVDGLLLSNKAEFLIPG